MKWISATIRQLKVKSPSTRREWIEIDIAKVVKGICDQSPSTRREWIEIRGILSDFKNG